MQLKKVLTASFQDSIAKNSSNTSQIPEDKGGEAADTFTLCISESCVVPMTCFWIVLSLCILEDILELAKDIYVEKMCNSYADTKY